jgi:sulfate/thiosulfate transport system ATP-binding protein
MEVSQTAGAVEPTDTMTPGGSLPDIRLRGLTKRYGDFAAVDAVDLEVAQGEFFTLLGPSGSGKTTTLRLVAGFAIPDAGTVELRGRDVTRLPPYAREVNTVFQDYALFPHMSIGDNVEYGPRIAKVPRGERRRRAAEGVELVRLPGYEKRSPAQLSGGQRQRMALARALAVEPKVLLLDEPFGALDARVRAELREWLRRLHDEVHVTTVFVTHDQEEAMEVADQIAVMNRGAVEQVGGARDLYEHPATEFVLGFVGPTTRVGGAWVRPHDLELLLLPVDGADEAMIERVVHLGFEVRVELVRADGESVWAQLTRDECEELELVAGQIVYVRAQAERVFAAAGS